MQLPFKEWQTSELRDWKKLEAGKGNPIQSGCSGVRWEPILDLMLFNIGFITWTERPVSLVTMADANHMHFLVGVGAVMNLEINWADQKCKMGGCILEISDPKTGLEVIWDKLPNMLLPV